MKTAHIRILAYAFSAFFPPKKRKKGDDGKDAEDDYYEILGVDRNATTDDIRRAYKRKSLELHPDKIAQKRSQPLSSSEYEACHAKFQRMKEASDCLSDPTKRELYDALGMERYKFVQDPSGNLDPATLFDNLGRSSCYDRTKVFLIVFFVVGLILLQPILICIKTDSILNEQGGAFENTDWSLIFIPLWILNVLASLLLMGFKRWSWLVQWLCLVVLEVFLAVKFDDHVSWNYAIVFIPLYVFLVARIVDSIRWIVKINEEIDKMITVPFLEKYVLNGSDDDGDAFTADEGHVANDVENGDDTPPSNDEQHVIKSIRRQHTMGSYIRYADLNDEERDKINDVFVIVHIPPDAQDDDSDDDSHDGVAENNIYTSPEFQQAVSVRDDCVTTIKQFVLAYIPTIILVALRLDVSKHDWNWFLVFTPVWVMLGFRWIYACFTICCASSVSERELIMKAHAAAKEADKKKGTTNYGSMDLDTVEEGEEERNAGGKVSCNGEEKFFADLHVDGGGSGEGLKSGSNEGSPTPSRSTEIGSIDQTNSGEECEGGQDHEPQFEMDEEAFREAYQAEEEKAQTATAEAQSKAFGVCLFIMLQSLLLTLFLIKLNEEYDDVEGNSMSAFWVFSPILILFGIMLCCVCCAVYSVRDTDSIDAMKSGSQDDEEDAHQNEAKEHHSEEAVSQSYDYYGGSILDDHPDERSEPEPQQSLDQRVDIDPPPSEDVGVDSGNSLDDLD